MPNRECQIYSSCRLHLVGTILGSQELRIESDDNNKIDGGLHNFLAYIGQNDDTLTQFVINR